MKEISVRDIKGIRIGQSENADAGTGCTVIISEIGAPTGLDVRGGGPASRESELLKPLANADRINAVVLAGGSAFGLDAAGGVMQYLEEHDIGFDVGVTKVPLVCQSDLFDLTVGNMSVRPDKEMGYAACVNSERGNYKDGNYGAGTGATVGKLYGMDFCMKSGIGSYAVQIDDLQIGAIVAVNALGDIYDWKNGRKAAGLLDESKKGFRSTTDEMYRNYEVVKNKFTGNTTIGVIITNGKFNKTELTKIAGMAHNGYARSVRPVHTTADGDSIYAMSAGEIAADMDMVGTLAADVMSEAILRAVYSADSAYGYVSAKDIKWSVEKMNFIIERNRIFKENENGKVIAEITFPETEKGVFCIDHTFVDDSLRGQGIAGQLVQLAVNKIKEQGGKVAATCSYAQHWLEKHKI